MLAAANLTVEVVCPQNFRPFDSGRQYFIGRPRTNVCELPLSLLNGTRFLSIALSSSPLSTDSQVAHSQSEVIVRSTCKERLKNTFDHLSSKQRRSKRTRIHAGLGLRQSLLSDVTLDAFSGRFLHCRFETEAISFLPCDRYEKPPSRPHQRRSTQSSRKDSVKKLFNGVYQDLLFD
jgi:hypothetical protein